MRTMTMFGLLALALLASGCGAAGNPNGAGEPIYGSAAAGIPGPGTEPADSLSTPGTAAHGAADPAGPAPKGFRPMALDHDGLYAPMTRIERPETAGLGDFGYGTVGLAQRWDGRNRPRTPDGD